MGTGHSFWKNDIAQGYNINQLKSNGSTDDKSNSTKPWSLICKLNDTPRGGRTVPSHCQKTDEWVVPRWLGWPSHSLACEITQLKKTSHTTFHGPCTLLCDGPHPVECASLWIPTNTPLTYLCVSNWIFAVRHQSLSFIRSWSHRHHGFWPGSSPGRGELKDMGGKAVWKMCRGLPFTTCQKIC